ncbi:MAG: V-type ATP synthase subunit D [Ruminococcus sp.]|nr:V-type ATP synthase subunit D [Ruminococcus sp.]
MATTQINPTRMELTRLKKKLATATRGHKLLKDKRDELMRRFLDMARLNRELRLKVEKAISDANNNFVLASASMSQQALSLALLAPKQEVLIDVSYKNIMSVDTPEFKVHTRTSDENDIYCYGLAFTSGDMDNAVSSLAAVLPDMLRLAEIEKSCQLLSAEIEKTRRRVNALEHVLIPQTKESIRFISMKLDENERATQTRLMKVKSRVLQKAHNY